MGRIVLVVYRPLEGKAADLEGLVREHFSILKQENLVTTRAPVIMRAGDQSIIEIFEWASEEAIQKAHDNERIQQLWEKFARTCTYEKPVAVPEFSQLFSEFEPLN